MRPAAIVVLALLALAPASRASDKWTAYCARGLTAFADPAARGYFRLHLDPAEAAAALRPPAAGETAPPARLRLADGKELTLTLARPAGGNGTAHTLTLMSGDKTVTTLRFNYNPGDRRLHLTHAETSPEFAGQGAGDTLVGVALSLFPQTAQVTGGLAWVNFMKTAEGLAGREMRDMHAAEGVVGLAVTAARPALAAAVDNSPSGRALAARGFRADPDGFTFTPSEFTEGEGPILNVRWIPR